MEIVGKDTLFRQWLCNEKWTPRELLDWCYGRGLGLGRDSDSPFRYLLDALPPGAARHPMACRLAARVAETLRAKPALDFEHPGLRPALYNLFKLTASLDCPDELSGVLWEIYERHVAAPAPVLSGEVRVAFGDALAGNQHPHVGLQAVWMSLLDDVENPLLGANPVNGWRGVLMQPDADGQADSGAIGIALSKMAAHLDGDHDRRERFRRLVREAEAVWRLRAEDFINMADACWKQKTPWPEWAVDALPQLFVVNDREKARDVHSVLLWHWYFRCVESVVKAKRVFCGGLIREVEMDSVDYRWFEQAVLRMEKLRSPRGITEREARAAIEHELRFLTKEAESKMASKGDSHAKKKVTSRHNQDPPKKAVRTALQQVDSEFRDGLSLPRVRELILA